MGAKAARASIYVKIKRENGALASTLTAVCTLQQVVCVSG